MTAAIDPGWEGRLYLPRRQAGWERRLFDHLARAAATPFAWGVHDCALFAAGAVLTMTGCDPARELRGRYASAAGALRALRRFLRVRRVPAADAGGLIGTVASVICAEHGFAPWRSPLAARRGDLALAAWGDITGGLGVEDGKIFGGALGICVGAEAAFLMPSGGFTRLPIAGLTRAWRTG